MPRFRKEKHRLMQLLQGDSWLEGLRDEFAGADKAALSGVISPLLSFLSRPELRWRAAFALGKATALLAGMDMETARVIMRRLMWSMNEESGNLGWGVPEAMGCILAESPALAREYARIFITYVRETKREDNFVEHPPLRTGAYWGVGHLAASTPELVLPVLDSLITALSEEDPVNRGMAAWALGRLAHAAPESAFAEERREAWEKALRAMDALKEREEPHLEIMEQGVVLTRSAGEIADDAGRAVKTRLDGCGT